MLTTNNIRPVWQKYNLLLTTWLLVAGNALAQPIPIPLNKYGLKVINTPTLYRKITVADSSFSLVSISDIPHISWDLRYAGTNNFMKKKLYAKDAHPFLLLPAATALRKAAEDLASQGYGLLVWDAYRPYAVTGRIWREVKDERYAANPAKGSGHNRGLSIDCTLYELKTGNPVPMPTEFDDFSERAHHQYSRLPEQIVKNRNLLKSAMEKHGFNPLSTEWWHYSFPNTKNFPILGISFHILK